MATKSYSTFIFENYSFDPQTKKISLTYSFDSELKFTEEIQLNHNAPVENATSKDFDSALFALHLAGGISYYKAFAPKNIEVKSGKLNPQQADFWNIFYTKGLGEFFYKNKIDFNGLVRFPESADAPQALVESPAFMPVFSERTSEAHFMLPKNHKVRPARTEENDWHKSPQSALVPFGGGKDSQVTVEILRRAGIKMHLFRMQNHPFITELAKLNELPLVTLSRKLDPQIYELNRQGALNGHIPITGYVTFLSIAVALLYGFDSVFFSNERSSNFGNVQYLGMQVNHQWSKSFEAEQMLAGYSKDFVTSKVQYLNLLRPLSELHIAKIFTREPKYLAHTTSCNRNWLWNDLEKSPHSGHWCGECEKCAFIFALYAAFLPPETAIPIFGKNLFEDTNLLHTYRQLWGKEAFKPFECVGTPEEMQAAMLLATKDDAWRQTFIAQDFILNALPDIKNPDEQTKAELTPDFTNISPFVTKIIKKETAYEDLPA